MDVFFLQLQKAKYRKNNLITQKNLKKFNEHAVHIFHQHIFDIIRDFYEENMLNILYPLGIIHRGRKRDIRSAEDYHSRLFSIFHCEVYSEYTITQDTTLV
jgi:hypothetical protein